MLRLAKLLGWLSGVVLLTSASLVAQADFSFDGLRPALGSADRYGYAEWATKIGGVELNQKKIPLMLVFTTDPRIAPGPLGRGWFIPLFNSSLVDVSQSTMRWHRPDGRIFYFVRQRGDTNARPSPPDAPEEFQSRGGDWRALRDSKRHLVVLTHNKSGTELTYSEGLLTRLCFEKQSIATTRYEISYTPNRQPKRLYVYGSGKSVIEFAYGDARLATELRVEDTLVSFKYSSDEALNGFAPVPYLSNVSGGLQSVSMAYGARSADSNGVSIHSLSVKDSIVSLVWNAHSGFIEEDDGAKYTIENSSLVNGGRPAVNQKVGAQGARNKPIVLGYNWDPNESRISRVDRDGRSESRYYDRAKGVNTRVDKNGVKTITYYLLTPGPMMNKIRKVEEVRGAQVSEIERNAYDELGRRVRQINRDGAVTIWEYLDGGNHIRRIVDGVLVDERIYRDKILIASKAYELGGEKLFINPIAKARFGVTADNVSTFFKD